MKTCKHMPSHECPTQQFSRTRLLFEDLVRERSCFFARNFSSLPAVCKLAVSAKEKDHLRLEGPELRGGLVIPERILEVEALPGARAAHRRGDQALIQNFARVLGHLPEFHPH